MTKNDGGTRGCPGCGRELGPGAKGCPECGASESRKQDLGQELVTVYEPPDQMAALAAAALLEEQGIRATVRSEQIAMYDGLAMMMRPRWGKVLVLESDRHRALEALEEFLGQTPEAGATDGGPVEK